MPGQLGGVASFRRGKVSRAHPKLDGAFEFEWRAFHVGNTFPSIHPLRPYSVQNVGAAEAVSLAIWHNPGWVVTPTQDTNKLALILPTSEG